MICPAQYTQTFLSAGLCVCVWEVRTLNIKVVTKILVLEIGYTLRSPELTVHSPHLLLDNSVASQCYVHLQLTHYRLFLLTNKAYLQLKYMEMLFIVLEEQLLNCYYSFNLRYYAL